MTLAATDLSKAGRNGLRARPVWLLIAVAVMSGVLTIAGCASSSGPSSAGKSASSGAPPGVTYAACIRSHGVPAFADPVITGGGAGLGFRVPRADRNSPQFQAAVHACRNFEPGMAGATAGGGTP